jgi:Cytochrome c7 and related cytochrome c
MGSGKSTRVLIAVGLLVVCAAVFASAADLYPYTAEELTGPEQPIQFNHQIHAGGITDGNLGIPCLYCHGPAERGWDATVPAVSVCMGCHQYVKQGRTPGPEQEIAKIHEHYEKGESIPWVRVHWVPDFVQFKHMRHVQKGVACQECHGQVQDMKRVYLVPQTRFTKRSFFLPTQKLEMGWCMECHLQRGATDDCVACHY